MKILIDLRSEIGDSWRKLRPGEQLPDVGDWIIDLPRLRSDSPSLCGRRGRIGVWLEPDQAIEFLVEHLEQLAIVELRFPVFADGRALSQARLLRERLGFRGDIRASGEVAPDLVAFMAACGINQFELTPADAAVVFEHAAIDRREFASLLARSGETATHPCQAGLLDTGTFS